MATAALQQVVRRQTILKHRDETMKIRSEDTVDPQIRKQLDTAGKKYDEAFNKNDAAAVAALFTQDAVEVGPNGPVYGQQALEKHYRELFHDWHPTDHLNTIDRVYMLGKDACVIMKWSVGEYKGYVTTINVHEGDNWPVRIATFNMTSPPATTPSPTTTPSSQ